MGQKKINLKSSLSSINAKATLGKKKTLPKLKVILANPYKPEQATLTGDDLSEFTDLLASEIKDSGTSGTVFARQNHIQLGLGSSLRAIKNRKASCVMVSKSIKPRFIIDQIGYFAKQINDTVPVFLVDDWDKLSVNIFGVRALVVVFPAVSGKLKTWISNRTLQREVKQQSTNNIMEPTMPINQPKDDSKINLSSMYLMKSPTGERSFVPDVVVKSKPIPSYKEKDWTGEFISFSDPTEEADESSMDMDEIDEEFRRKQDKILDKLKEMASKTEEDDIEHVPKVSMKSKEETAKPVIKKNMAFDVGEEWENDASYISLKVHKIQPNPNRKPKNKRKNKKNKEKNKNKKQSVK